MARFCDVCGAPLEGHERFCTSCGAPVATPTDEEPSEAERPDETEAIPPADSSPTKETEPNEGTTVQPSPDDVQGSKPDGEKGNGNKGRRTKVLVAVALLLVVAAVVGVLALTQHGGSPTSTEPESQTISLKFVTPNYSEKTDSKIPLKVTGKTSTGEKYDKTFYVSPSKSQLKVPTGTYELSMPASPLLASGDIYELPKPVSLDTKEAAGKSADSSNGDVPTVTFKVKPAKDATKDDVAAAKASAKESGLKADRIENLTKAAVNKQVVDLYGGILDGIQDVDFDASGKGEFKPQSYEYALQDINGDNLPDLLVMGDQDSVQHYCVWVASQDGSGVTQAQVPDDVMTRNGYASSYRFLLHGSNKGNGLLSSQLSNSGSAMSTTQRYVVKDGKLVADGDAIQSQTAGELAPKVKSESVEINFVDTSDRSLLEALAKGEEIPTADDKQTQSQDSQAKESATDKAIDDAKAKGLVVLTGTVRKMNGSDALNLSENLGLMTSENAKEMRSQPEVYGDTLAETYTIFVLDDPQEIAWRFVGPDEEMSTNGMKTYIIGLDDNMAAYDGRHVTAAFDNKNGYWSDELNPLGQSPSCLSVGVLAVG